MMCDMLMDVLADTGRHVLADTADAGFNSTCGGDAECSLWLIDAGGRPSEADFGNLTAFAESLGCDFADLCTLPGGSCDVLESYVPVNASGTEMMCDMLMDVLADTGRHVLADTADAGFNSTCGGDAECTLWFMEGEAGFGNLTDFAESLGCDFA